MNKTNNQASLAEAIAERARAGRISSPTLSPETVSFPQTIDNVVLVNADYIAAYAEVMHDLDRCGVETFDRDVMREYTEGVLRQAVKELMALEIFWRQVGCQQTEIRDDERNNIGYRRESDGAEA